MKAGAVKIAVQAALEIPEAKRFPNIGPLTKEAFAKLAITPNEEEWNEPAGSDGRDINANGLELVKHFESLFLVAYKDPVGILTIGWGHTGLQHKDGTVYAGRKITTEKAEQLLMYDMNQFEARVLSLVKVPLDDNQFSALVSFDFNTGALHSSTLLRMLNRGDYEGAADQFLVWNKGTVRGVKEVLAGLTRRRKSERNLFLSKKPFIIT